MVASCPPLAPLADASFGATTAKLVEVAGQYRKCRAAALGAVTDSPTAPATQPAGVPAAPAQEPHR